MNLLFKTVKSHVDSAPNGNKRTIIYDKELMLRAEFKRLKITKYLLFVKKDTQFVVADWFGAFPKEIEQVSFSENSLVSDCFKGTQNQSILLSSIEQVYHDAMFVPKEMISVVKREKKFFEENSFDQGISLWRKGELSGFYFFQSTKKSIQKRELTAFIKKLSVLSRYYYELYVDNQFNDLKAMQKMMLNFTESLVSSKNSSSTSTLILNYCLSHLSSTKGMLIQLRKGYYQPLVYENISFIKSYPKEDVLEMLKGKSFDINGKRSLLYEEFGNGTVEIFPINNKCVALIKTSYSISLNQDGLRHMLLLAGRILSCQERITTTKR